MQTVERWGVFEAKLSGPADGNPFVDVQLSARFEQADRQFVVAGFYDGDGVYRARFMPDAVGEWRFRTSSPCPQLDGIEGSFECTPETDGNRGPVGVWGNESFRYADGTPFLPFGTTAYAWVHQSPDVVEMTLDSLRHSPFNKIRMCVFPKHYHYNEREPDLYPFPLVSRGSSEWTGYTDGFTDRGWKFDTSAFVPAFFRNFERRIEQLGSLGIEADVILFHPYDRWGFAKLSAEDDERYLEYVVARLSAFRNVWWSLANEFDILMEKSTERWDRAFELIQEKDPYDHLRSIHNWVAFYDHSKPWVTHLSVQNDDVARVLVWRHRYEKPVIVDECGYEGDLEEPYGNLSGHEMLHRCWVGATAGGYVTHGETYVEKRDQIWWSHGGRLIGESPARIGFLRTLLQDAPQPLAPLPGTPASMHALLPPVEEMDLETGWEWLRRAYSPDRREEEHVYNPYPTVHSSVDYYLMYFGPRQPSEYVAAVPSGHQYQADLIDTWEMTITPISSAVERGTLLNLPSKPYQALRLTRIPPR